MVFDDFLLVDWRWKKCWLVGWFIGIVVNVCIVVIGLVVCWGFGFDLKGCVDDLLFFC